MVDMGVWWHALAFVTHERAKMSHKPGRNVTQAGPKCHTRAKMSHSHVIIGLNSVAMGLYSKCYTGTTLSCVQMVLHLAVLWCGYIIRTSINKGIWQKWYNKILDTILNSLICSYSNIKLSWWDWSWHIALWIEIHSRLHNGPIEIAWNIHQHQVV